MPDLTDHPHGRLTDDHGIDDEVLTPLAELVIEIEAFHHAQGWDEMPAMLYLITTLATDENMVAFGAQPAPISNPRKELTEISVTMQMLAETDVEFEEMPFELREALMEKYGKTPAAHLFVTETWMYQADDKAEIDRIMSEGRSLADVPGSVEARQALLVRDGDLIILTRQRGKEPRIDCVKHGEDDKLKIGGELMGPLFMLDGASRAFSEKVKEARP